MIQKALAKNVIQTKCCDGLSYCCGLFLTYVACNVIQAHQLFSLDTAMTSLNNNLNLAAQ